MSLWKLPFLVAGARGTWLSLTPPQQPANKTEIAKKEGIEKYFGSVVLMHAFVWKTTVITSTVLGIASILRAYLPPSFHSSYSPASPSPASGTVFVLGVALSLASGVIRDACYNELGRLFTFEITLRPNHQLVTSGPYSYVRHPSYAGVLLGVVGTLLLHFGPETWYAAVVLPTVAGKMYAAMWCGIETFVLWSILARAPLEDRLLRSQFGEKWEEYAARVRWRVVPGIF
ncbi:ICMT-domain-containing protein [Peniophora sp. CONT]|nr:ICMT-domain-containing protein [Peniophora sp. CONT]